MGGISLDGRDGTRRDRRTALAGDWPMRGRDRTRNSVVSEESLPVDWHFGTDTQPAKKIRWSAEVGTLSQGDPVISDGLVWIGTNNGQPRDPSRKEDAGVLMCFDVRDGTFVYQYVSPRLAEGRDVDWPSSSQAGSPFIERDRLWYFNNRCEVICLDISPLLMRSGPASVVWKVDLRREFGVYCRGVMIGTNCSQCSIAAYGDFDLRQYHKCVKIRQDSLARVSELDLFRKEVGERQMAR